MADTGVVRSLFFMLRFAWFIITALIWAGFQLGWSCRSSVATPETCGAAIEVPESSIASFPVPTAAAAMLNPGAEMSGFRSLVSRAGPSDEKSVNASSKPGMIAGTSLIVALTAPSL